MKTYALVFFLIGIVSFSCQKDDDNDDDDNKSRTELITSATWKYDNMMVDTDKDGDADSPVPSGYLESCETDNTLTLHTGGHGVLEEGSTKCDPSDPQSTDFTWELKDNETVLSTSSPIFGSFSGDAKITVLTSSKLQLQKEITVPVLGSVNVILDLKH
jgi:hypothetical protein